MTEGGDSRWPEAGSHVVVTGGAGFIGSHTVGRLLDAGHRVVVLDNFSTGKRVNLEPWAGHERLTVVECNIVDGLWPPLAQAVREHGPVDRIIHLAAQVSVIKSIQSPLDDVRQNYQPMIQVLEYARREHVEQVVFASSAAVYGDLDRVPVTESDPTAPMSPYGIHKLASELQLAYYHRVHGVGTTALRFFNVYGPRQDPTSPYSGVISIFLHRALSGAPLTIFGDGEQTRDFVYVGDVARAVVAACFAPEARGQVLNIGTGRRLSVRALAETILSLSGSRSPVQYAAARPGEIQHSAADVSRAQSLLGYHAEVDVDTGLARTLAWFREASAPQGR